LINEKPAPIPSFQGRDGFDDNGEEDVTTAIAKMSLNYCCNYFAMIRRHAQYTKSSRPKTGRLTLWHEV